MVDKKYCKKCKWSFKDTGVNYCQYILCTGKMIGHLRRTDGKCDFYEKGKQAPTIDTDPKRSPLGVRK